MDSQAPDAITPPWRVVGASVVGTSHRRSGMPCQDAHGWAVLPNGTLVVAVADGAGSAPRADEGARCAVDAAIAYVVAVMDEAVPVDEPGWHAATHAAFAAAIDALAMAAEETGTVMREYGATLTVVVATAAEFVAAQIGDGIVAAEDANGSLFVAATPQRGEYANEVALLTMPDATACIALTVMPAPMRAFAVTTDGLLRLAVRLPDYAPHAPFFQPLFAFLAETGDLPAAEAELAAFLASARVARRTDDDTTLVLAVRTGDDTPGPADMADTPGVG